MSQWNPPAQLMYADKNCKKIRSFSGGWQGSRRDINY
jgi:hypothetical protein